MAMATVVDGVLMVVRTGQTNRNALGSALATLARLRANVVGIVMNGARRFERGLLLPLLWSELLSALWRPEGAAS